MHKYLTVRKKKKKKVKRDNPIKSRIRTELQHKNKMERYWLLWCVNSLFSPLLIQVFSCIFTPDCTFTDTTMYIYTCFSAYLCSNYFVYHCLPTPFMGQELMLLLWSLYSLLPTWHATKLPLLSPKLYQQHPGGRLCLYRILRAKFQTKHAYWCLHLCGLPFLNGFTFPGKWPLCYTCVSGGRAYKLPLLPFNERKTRRLGEQSTESSVMVVENKSFALKLYHHKWAPQYSS